jgi:hypothetical protein
MPSIFSYGGSGLYPASQTHPPIWPITVEACGNETCSYPRTVRLAAEVVTAGR